MKTIVRITAVLPDNIAIIQRLYDMGTTFKLEEEHMHGAHKIADFIIELKKRGCKLLDCHEYIGDDDMEKHISVSYEYISD